MLSNVKKNIHCFSHHVCCTSSATTTCCSRSSSIPTTPPSECNHRVPRDESSHLRYQQVPCTSLDLWLWRDRSSATSVDGRATCNRCVDHHRGCARRQCHPRCCHAVVAEGCIRLVTGTNPCMTYAIIICCVAVAVFVQGGVETRLGGHVAALLHHWCCWFFRYQPSQRCRLRNRPHGSQHSTIWRSHKAPIAPETAQIRVLAVTSPALDPAWQSCTSCFALCSWSDY